jgi:uncharacterized RDD family membrane protein YckC
MVDEANGAAGGGVPSYPGGTSEGAPPMPPRMPPPPPSYPTPPAGGYPPPQAGYSATPGLPGGSPYASWGLRLGGYLIDGVILGVVQVILNAGFRHTNALTLHMTMTNNNGTVRHNSISFVAIGLGLVVALAYSTVFIGSAGKTVGMMAVGVRCVRDETREAVGYGKAFARSLVEIIFRITVIVWIIDMLFPIWDAKRQTIHDKVVSTVVLRTRNAG